ncbi:heavy metal-associated domain-containing protein [Peptostreptococcus canis]|uniref:heavy metal-associated domain-containing protein n=1 Tax=Peptostreptococcus canis TaxID=1159213 RepID=UPI002ED2B220|nr:cation transport ATPase [Peptostreptococcus canis]
MSKIEMILKGLNCAHCASKIEEKVNKMEEIDSATLNFVNKKITLQITEGNKIDDVVDKVTNIIDNTEPGLEITIIDDKKNNTQDCG